MGDSLYIMGVKLEKKHAAIAMRACYRACYKTASRHPVVVVIILFTIWFNRSFPRLFSFLFYASPVILSTSALLGTLLLYGHQKSPKIKTEEKPDHHEIDSVRYRVIEDTEFDEKCVKSENAFSNTVNPNDDDHRRVETISRRSSIDSHISMADKKLIEEAKSQVCDHNQKTDSIREKIVYVSRCPHCQSPLPNNTQDHKRWEIGSEVSSRAASMAGDILPPFLLPEVPHHVPMSNVNSYAPSIQSLASHDHDDDNDNEEEEENVDDKEDCLRNFGKTETEKTQPIENLIARKKAIRNMRIQAEENLVNINLDISYSATPVASTRRNSFDLNDTTLESLPSINLPDPFDLPYEQSGDRSYPVGPTFESESSSFQPNHEFSHTQESYDMGPSNQNEGFYTYGISENVSQRSRSSDDDDDVAKTSEIRKEKSTAGTPFESDSLSFQPNDQFDHRHESSDVGPSTLEEYHASEVIQYVSFNNQTVKIHHVERGYQGKILGSESSSSSAFSDVTEHLDDVEDEYDFRSAFMPSTPDRQFQEQSKEDDHTIKRSPKSEHEEGMLSQRPSRVARWFGRKP